MNIPAAVTIAIFDRFAATSIARLRGIKAHARLLKKPFSSSYVSLRMLITSGADFFMYLLCIFLLRIRDGLKGGLILIFIWCRSALREVE